jgi:hypothetical protein
MLLVFEVIESVDELQLGGNDYYGGHLSSDRFYARL